MCLFLYIKLKETINKIYYTWVSMTQGLHLNAYFGMKISDKIYKFKLYEKKKQFPEYNVTLIDQTNAYSN